MNILSGFNSDLFTGHRVIRVDGWDEFKSLQVPPDCEILAIDKNPEKNYLYMKRTDSLGNPTNERHEYFLSPVEEFDPKKYVTVDQLDDLREEVKNGFDTLKQSLAANTANSGSTKSYNGNK